MQFKCGVQLYTDGSANAATGNGGWAFAIVTSYDNQLVQAESGGEPGTTNNRMELQAVINGLKVFPLDKPLEIVSDSAYVINCFTQKWYEKWRARGWYTSTGKVKNKDLWMELLELVEARTAATYFTHVRGHSGLYWNEHVDRMCRKEYRALE